MNKKKIFGYLFMGLLAAGATGTVTSCKDYDDDINNNKSAIQALQSDLAKAKTDLESEISSLKTQLETANGTLTALSRKVDANTADITKAKSDIAGLEARLKTAEDAIKSINTTLALKADQKALEDSCASIYGKLESVTDGLGKSLKSEKDDRVAADADLQQQIDALNKLIGNGSVDNAKTVYEKLLADVQALQEKTQDLDVEALTSQLQGLSNSIDKINANINVLNVLLEKSLRSLVFIPQSYYWGVEATKLLYLDFKYVNDLAWISDMNWDKKEAKGYGDNARYDMGNGTKVLTFAATYHMNPSSAKLDENTTKVSVESGDLDYITRAAAAGISVKSWAAQNGILTVNLDVNDPTKIKSVEENQMITNFATKVNVATKNDKDTTITSDYATLYTEKVSDLKLALTNNEVNGHIIPGAAKSELSPCHVESGTSYGHLMQTVNEASNTYDAQVFCKWNETLDLKTLVETHYYKDVDKKFAKLDDATFNANFKYVFTLTALYKGANATDESAHAAIASDGVTFRPQAPTADGKQAAYGSEQVRAQEVGRTPVVRVTLVDQQTGKVYDYGYIRIEITGDTPTTADKSISYTGSDYSYNGECTPNAWSYSTEWYVTEQDLYKELGLTRKEFEDNYTLVGNVNNLTQFQADANGKFQEITEKIGTASSITDKGNDPDGTKSSTLKWELTSQQAYKLFVTDKKAGTSIAIKYKSADGSVGPDVYVVFKTGKLVGTLPSASLNLDPAKNSTIWSAKDGKAGSGKYEFDMNVDSPDDHNIKANGDKPFEKILAEAFVGNKINAAEIITNLVDKTAKNEYAASELKLDLKFDKANVGKEFQGISGNTYVLSVSTDGKTLEANIKGKTEKQAIVKIEDKGNKGINAQKAVYQPTDFAKDLLNYKKHDDLEGALTAIVGIYAQNACHELPLTDNTFNVRFLRPLNITNTTAEVEDAGDAAQVIDLMSLLTFSDWRDLWKTDYKKFYGIKGVEVVGVQNGQKISTNPDVLTDQNGNTEKMVPLQNVNGAIDFVYSYGKLTYKNYNSTTDDFKVQIPVVVTYDWGKVPQTITVTVKRTHSNAKKH